jgi:hypothetical protein
MLTWQLNAQVNILYKAGIKRIIPEAFSEYGGSYYFLSYSFKDSVYYPKIGYSHIKPTQVYMHKVNKYSNALTTTCIAMGDTMQADSIVDAQYCFFAVNDGRIHIAFRKIFVKDTNTFEGVQHSLCYLQLDTNLNIVVPDTRLLYSDQTGRIYSVQPAGIATGQSKTTIVYTQADTAQNYNGWMTSYKQLNFSGNIIQEGIVGRIDTSGGKTREHFVFNFQSISGNKYIIGGKGIQWKNIYTYFIADENMHMVDSGALDLFLNNVPPGEDASSYRPAEIVVLENSPNIIVGSVLHRYITLDSSVYHTGLAKYNNKVPFPVIDKAIVIKERDAIDLFHFNGYNTWDRDLHMAYNTKEHLAYYANSAYTNYASGECYYGYNYLQIVCADTNLNLKWRKFIFSGVDSCMWVRTVTACDERTGIVVVGRSNGISNMVDTSLQVDFAYRIDSDGYVSVNDVERQIARNRIEIYPNPATDKVTIDDVFDGNGIYYLYNTEGRLIKTAAYNRYNKTIHLDDYTPGLYLLRIIAANDETYTFKVLHQ